MITHILLWLRRRLMVHKLYLYARLNESTDDFQIYKYFYKTMRVALLLDKIDAHLKRKYNIIIKEDGSIKHGRKTTVRKK